MRVLATVLLVDTGLERYAIKVYANKSSTGPLLMNGERKIKYETRIEIPVDFGEVGAILVENGARKAVYIEDIVLDGLPNGPLNVICASWVHSKYDNPMIKRVFFPSKVCFT